MNTVTVHGLNNCDSCRKARRWLDEQGIAHRFVDYRAEPPAPATLRAWGRAVGWDRLVNRRSTTWRQLSEADRQASGEAELLALLGQQPTLIKRPVLQAGKTVLVGFDEAAWRAALDGRGV